jgi:uncharacterized protein with PIN domain
MISVNLRFHGDLAHFLHSDHRPNEETSSSALKLPIVISRQLRERSSVKDVIEACGVPHTEVDLLLIHRVDDPSPGAVDFAWLIEEPTEVDVYPTSVGESVHPWAPRLQLHYHSRFVVDGHLGKLARNLRLLGFDTALERDADDARLLEIMVAEDRALLTRDRPLLMHSIARHGYCPRSSDPEEQTREVVKRFNLNTQPGAAATFSRCLECNGLLQPVPKAEVLSLLAGEPLTLRHYNDFHRCDSCGKVFWKGTHFDKLADRVARLSAVLV